METNPRNPELDRRNPDLLAPPETDHGIMPNLKFSFSQAHTRHEDGGWAREVTRRELPIAATLAGVNMKLSPGGVRELHWHKQAEWSYMLQGRARITGMDAEGRSFTDDVGVGDLWYFPPGIPHSIQGLETGCEFLLVFNDGDFSEGGTFLISDWLAHTPRDVIAQNFGVTLHDLAGLPRAERYIFQGKLPGPLPGDRIPSSAGAVPQSFSHRLLQQAPVQTAGGIVRVADSANFAISTAIAAALVEIKPGGLRELHWHPTNDEWQYWIEGNGRMTVFGAQARARTFNFQAGDVGYVPFAMGHYIQNTGSGVLRFLEVFASDRYRDISLKQWRALTPPELVRQHLHLNDTMMAALDKRKVPITL